MMQANLKFLSSDKDLKVVTTSSTYRGANLQYLPIWLQPWLSQERKVLLIDADMRLPSQHRIWNLLNDAGLSNVLVGQAQLENDQRSNG